MLCCIATTIFIANTDIIHIATFSPIKAHSHVNVLFYINIELLRGCSGKCTPTFVGNMLPHP